MASIFTVFLSLFIFFLIFNSLYIFDRISLYFIFCKFLFLISHFCFFLYYFYFAFFLFLSVFFFKYCLYFIFMFFCLFFFSLCCFYYINKFDVCLFSFFFCLLIFLLFSFLILFRVARKTLSDHTYSVDSGVDAAFGQLSQPCDCAEVISGSVCSSLFPSVPSCSLSLCGWIMRSIALRIFCAWHWFPSKPKLANVYPGTLVALWAYT